MPSMVAVLLGDELCASHHTDLQHELVIVTNTIIGASGYAAWRC